MKARVASLTLGLLATVACGPPPRPDGDDSIPPPQPDADDHPTMATVTGRVWAPDQNPGRAAPGEEIPIAGALVYVSTTAPPPIPDHVYCETCVAKPNGAVLSGSDGRFALSAPPGEYTLTIQKGQYRMDQTVVLAAGMLDLPSNQTTLPSQWKPEAGLWMPRIAMAQGTNDDIEDILGKLGVGTSAGNVFVDPQGEDGPEITIYQYGGTAAGSVTYLLTNLDEMRRYHIIFFPCAVTMRDIDLLLRDQTVLANIRRYVAEGGKLYVTDWSGELVDRAFPQQITLGDPGADSDGTYDPATLDGTLTTAGDADGSVYTVTDGRAIDRDLHDWLGAQMGPTESNPTPQLYDPDRLEVTDLWNWIARVAPVQIGVDAMGQPVYDTPKTWLTGSKPGVLDGTNRPIAVTYQPVGCGKVMYTPFQTANGKHAGLFPQERVLLYLILELQTCSDNPIF